MNTIGNIIIALIFIGLIAKGQAEKISYKVMRSYVTNWGFDGVTVRTEIQVTNNSSVPVNIDGFQGEIYYQGRELAKIGLISEIGITPGTSGIVTIGAKIMYGPSTAVILESIRSGIIEKTVMLKGTLFAGRLRIPVATSYDLW